MPNYIFFSPHEIILLCSTGIDICKCANDTCLGLILAWWSIWCLSLWVTKSSQSFPRDSPTWLHGWLDIPTQSLMFTEMHVGLHCQILILLESISVLYYNALMWNLMKIHSIILKLPHADGWMDTAKLTGAYLWLLLPKQGCIKAEQTKTYL